MASHNHTTHTTHNHATRPAGPAARKAATPPAKALPADALQALFRLRTTHTQAEIARRLDVSDATVSGALSGKYIGNVDRLAERVRGELLNVKVACPILGTISTRICQDERAKPFSAATNPLRVQLWRQCKNCPHNPAAYPAIHPATHPSKGDPS